MIRASTLSAAMLSAAIFVPAVASFGQDDQETKESKLPSLNNLKWKLDALNHEPFKIIRSEIDDKRGLAYWVIELKRDLTVYESHGWWGPAYKDGKKTRFRFEFHDADGVTVKMIDGNYIGEFVEKKGKTFGTVLSIPPEMRFAKSVEAIGK